MFLFICICNERLSWCCRDLVITKKEACPIYTTAGDRGGMDTMVIVTTMEAFEVDIRDDDPIMIRIFEVIWWIIWVMEFDVTFVPRCVNGGAEVAVYRVSDETMGKFQPEMPFEWRTGKRSCRLVDNFVKWRSSIVVILSCFFFCVVSSFSFSDVWLVDICTLCLWTCAWYNRWLKFDLFFEQDPT